MALFIAKLPRVGLKLPSLIRRGAPGRTAPDQLGDRRNIIESALGYDRRALFPGCEFFELTVAAGS